MKVYTITTWLFGENIHIAYHEDTRNAIIIDPGMMKPEENEQIEQFLTDNNLTLKMILLSHGHVDHITGANWLAKKYGAPVMGSDDDKMYLSNLSLQASMFNLKIDTQSVKLDRVLKHGDVLQFDNEPLHVLAMPGHSQGGLAFYAPESQLVFTGDSVFLGSIGRTDLPGGNYETLIESIEREILTLPPNTLLYSGHGPTTTVAHERDFNPYL